MRQKYEKDRTVLVAIRGRKFLKDLRLGQRANVTVPFTFPQNN